MARFHMEQGIKLEEQERLAEITRYKEVIRSQRKKEERQKQKSKRTDTEDDYFDDFTPGRIDRIPERLQRCSRLSREYSVGLANILENIVEILREKLEISYLFLKPVLKKEVPDYLNIVKRPMDLSTIKENVRNLKYKSRKDFRHDIWQITYNAHLYNDNHNPGIPHLADQLLELCNFLLIENDASLTEAEAGIESG